MSVPVGLAQGLADIFNFGDPLAEDLPIPDIESEQPNQTLEQIFEQDILDPDVERLLKINERARVQSAKIVNRINEIDRRRRGDVPREGLIAKIGPVPVGFQVGSFLGVEQPVLRFAMDLVADPVNFVGGFGLTKLGKAARFLKGLSPAGKAQAIVRGARFAARIRLDPNLLADLKAAAKNFDAETVAKSFKELAEKKITPEQLTAIKRFDPDFARFVANPRSELQGLKEAFELADKQQAVARSSSLFDSIASGQRSLVSFQPPFVTSLKGDLTFPRVLDAIKKSRILPDKVVKGGKSALEAVKDAGQTAFRSTGAHFGNAIDTTNQAVVLDRLQKTSKQFLDVLSGRFMKREFDSDSWIGTGTNVVRVFQAERAAIQQFANDLPGFFNFMTKATPEAREAITRFLDEPGENLKLIEDLPDEAKNLATEARHLFDQMAELAVEESVLTQALDDYVTRVIRVKDNDAARKFRESLRRSFDKELNRARKFRRRGEPGNRFSIRRAFDTLREAENFLRRPGNAGSFEIVTKDIDKILQIYIASMGQAIVRNRGLRAMQKVSVFNSGAFKLAMKEADLDKLPRSLRAQQLKKSEYVTFNNPALEGFLFHKSVAPEMRAMFERSVIEDFRNKTPTTVLGRIVQGLDRFNSVAKASLFNLNPFFHATALTLSNFALLPPRQAVRGLRDFIEFFNLRADPEAATELLIKQMSRAVEGVDTNADDLIQQMRLSGLKLGRAQIDADDSFNVVQDLLARGLERVDERSVLRSPITGAKHLNAIADRSLWQVLQNSMKTQAWVHIRQAELDRIWRKTGRMPRGEQLLKINAEAGNIANQGFGGLAWEALAIRPNTRQLARFALLAPDWTLSNLLMARDLFVNLPGIRELAGRTIARDVMLSDMRFRWALGYNLRAAFYGYMGANLLNFAFTKYRTGNGRFLWENDEEAVDEGLKFKSRIELPWTRHDGRRQFMDIFKQFAEPMKLINNPPKAVAAKMGFIPRAFQTLIVGKDSFGNTIAGTDDGPYKQITARLFSLAGQFAPIPFQQAIQIAEGVRDPRSVALGTVGFSVRSESARGFQQLEQIGRLNQRLKEIEQQKRFAEQSAVLGGRSQIDRIILGR